MKIQHFAEEGNNSLIKINKNQPKVPFCGKKASCTLCGHEFIADGIHSELHLKKPVLSNDNQLTIPSYDRLGFSKDFEIALGDIVIIGSNDQDLEGLSTKIISVFQKNNIPLEELSPLLYTVEKLKSSRDKLSESKLIIINVDKTVPELIKFILKSCKTKIVFGLEELKVCCALHGSYKDSGLVNNIIASLGGDFNTRKRLVSTLEKGEFLVAKGANREEIRSLKDNSTN